MAEAKAPLVSLTLLFSSSLEQKPAQGEVNSQYKLATKPQ